MNETVKIPENHKRSLTALAAVSEERILTIEGSLANVSAEREIMTRLNDDMRQAEKDEVLKLISEFREQLIDFRDTFGLQPVERSLRSEVSMAAAYLWEDLAGAADASMSGYGFIEPESEAKAKECVERMLATVDKIRTAAAL